MAILFLKKHDHHEIFSRYGRKAKFLETFLSTFSIHKAHRLLIINSMGSNLAKGL